MSKEGKPDKKRGRPPRPLPVIEATPEDLARAMIDLPAGYHWQYEEKEREKPE